MEKKILIVDDNPGDRKLLEEALKEGNVDGQILYADRAQKAIVLAQKEQPQIIFMDVMMPVTSGGDTVRLLRNDVRTKNIPIVFLTGIWSKKEEQDLSKGINIEGQVYPTLSKPIDAKRLMSIVKQYV